MHNMWDEDNLFHFSNWANDAVVQNPFQKIATSWDQMETELEWQHCYNSWVVHAAPVGNWNEPVQMPVQGPAQLLVIHLTIL